MKKFVSMLILAVLLVGMFSISSGAAVKDTVVIEPLYNNSISVTNNFVIEEGGIARLTVGYTGKFGKFTSARITSKLQVQTSSGWADVDNGEESCEWVDESTNVIFTTTHTLEVSRGTYRALITYELYGTGGATDVIERTIEYTY